MIIHDKAEIQEFGLPNGPDTCISNCLAGAYLAWIESAQRGPVAEKANKMLKGPRPFESNFTLTNLKTTPQIRLLDDPKDVKIIAPKKYQPDGSLLWWFPPSDEPDPTRKQMKKEKNRELLDDGLPSKDPSRLFWMRLDLLNQFTSQDLREHEMSPFRLFSSPFRNGSWINQVITDEYGMEDMTYDALHTLEGNLLYKGQFFVRVNPAFVPPFSYYEIACIYLPEHINRDQFIQLLTSKAEETISEQQARSSAIKPEIAKKLDEWANGPRRTRTTLTAWVKRLATAIALSTEEATTLISSQPREALLSRYPDQALAVNEIYDLKNTLQKEIDLCLILDSHLRIV